MQKTFRIDDFSVHVYRVEKLFDSDIHKRFLFKRTNCRYCEWISKTGDMSTVRYAKDFYLYENTESKMPYLRMLLYKQHELKQREKIIHHGLALCEQFTNACILYDGVELDNKHEKHFCFQVLNKERIPVVQDCEKSDYRELISQQEGGCIHILKNYIRSGFIIESKDCKWIVDTYNSIEKLLGRTYSIGKYPYLNFLLWKDKDYFKLLIFPRVVHRPSQYYTFENSPLKIEPGAADLGGCILADNDEVFNKLNSALIKNIYQQIAFNVDRIRELAKAVSSNQ